MVGIAYSLPEYQVAGGPRWIENVRFDIVAKAPGRASQKDLRAMLGVLLTDRFRLRFERVSKSAPGFALVVANGGPKFKRAAASDSRKGVFYGKGEVSGPRISMAALARLVSKEVNAPVADMTGLEGDYDITLHYEIRLPNIGTGNVVPPPESEARPWIGSAINDDLGLRLERRAVPIDMLIITHVERPSPN
jgi:uncharacterized protein (TIGR03435 family)